MQDIGWLKYTRGGRVCPCPECIVDVFVCNGERDPFKTMVTVECEAYAGWQVTGKSSSADCDYLWDLYKLLQVPSPIRVFLARLPATRHSTLAQRVADLVQAYQRNYRTDDRIFSALFPTSQFDPTDPAAVPIVGWVSKANGKLQRI
jgi:hypothetical protein